MLNEIALDHISTLADVGVAGAAMFAAWQGIKGLTAWRTEQLGIRKIELAETALTQFYQIEHAFDSIRSPMSYSSESQGREIPADESPAQKHNRDLAQTAWNRLDKQRELFQELYATGLKLKVHFGQEAYDQCETMRRCFHKVSVAARMLYDTPYEGYTDLTFQRQLEADIWDMNSEDNGSIERRVKSAAKEAERILGEQLK